MSLCTESLETVFRRHSKRNHTTLHEFSPPSAPVPSHRKLLSSVPFFVATERNAETTVAQVHHDSCTEQISEKSATVREKKKPPFVKHSQRCQLRSVQHTHDVFKLTRAALNCTPYLLVPHHKTPFPTICPTKFSLSHLHHHAFYFIVLLVVSEEG